MTKRDHIRLHKVLQIKANAAFNEWSAWCIQVGLESINCEPSELHFYATMIDKQIKSLKSLMQEPKTNQIKSLVQQIEKNLEKAFNLQQTLETQLVFQAKLLQKQIFIRETKPIKIESRKPKPKPEPEVFEPIPKVKINEKKKERIAEWKKQRQKYEEPKVIKKTKIIYRQKRQKPIKKPSVKPKFQIDPETKLRIEQKSKNMLLRRIITKTESKPIRKIKISGCSRLMAPTISSSLKKIDSKSSLLSVFCIPKLCIPEWRK